MGLVCRPILMYNEYVPAIVGRRTWQYQVLGHHDGMDVKEPVYIERTESFQALYDVYAQEDEAADYSIQIHYGLHEDDGREEQFWNKANLFTFISFIQFKGKKISEYNKYLEEGFGKNTQLSVRVYFALDSNDSILVVKCNRYELGIQFINALHEDIDNQYPFEISNSYSVFAFEKQRLHQSEYSRDEIIDKVELRIAESYPGSVVLLYRKLHEKLGDEMNVRMNRYSLLGMDDEAIEIENISCHTFLELYAEDSGILCNSNRETQRYAAAITTKLMYKMQNGCNVVDRETSIGNKTFSDALYEYITYCYDGKNSKSELAEKRTLVRIVNALGKIEYARSRSGTVIEYNFFTLFFSFYFFVYLHAKEDEQSKEYYDFLTYFNICTQNCDKPERIFLQNTDFNIRYFEMQTKYFTLYSAYIYRLKRLLNSNGKNKYEFILCPGMSARTEVSEFLEREDDEYRLFKVEIAETTMYNLRDMLCILGHEVAHFVGTNILHKQFRRHENIYDRSG